MTRSVENTAPEMDRYGHEMQVEPIIANCAYCDQYACDDLERLLSICDQQEGFFSYARQARIMLEAIRARRAE